MLSKLRIKFSEDAMPENFITMLGFLTIFLLSGFVFGCVFTRSRNRKTLQAMEADLESKIKKERGELSLEFAAELGSLRSSLLGVARSYDGALRLIKENLPDDIDLSRSLADGRHVPAELGFESSRPVDSPRILKTEPRSQSETLSTKEGTEASSGSDSESLAHEAVSSRERSRDQDYNREGAGLDKTPTKEKIEPSEDSTKARPASSSGAAEQSSIYLANNDFADSDFTDSDFTDSDSADNLKNGRLSSS